MLANSRGRIAAGVGVVLFCAGTTVQAEGRWNARVGGALSVTATDNVCLENGGDKVGWISSFVPRASISRRTRDSALSVFGSVNMNSLTNSALNSKGCSGSFNDRDQYDPQLRANYRRTLIPGRLRLAVRGRIEENQVSSRFLDDDEFGRNSNQNTYYRYAISPTYSQPLGNNLNMRASYTWDQLFNDNTLLTDSNRHSVDLRFTSNRFGRWSTFLAGRQNVTQFGENRNGRTREDQEYGSANFGVALNFGTQFAIDGSVGYDWSNFQSFGNDTGGTAWSAGFVWTPSPRTRIRLSQGDRFFGNTPRVDISHESRRSRFNLNYDKTLRFGRDIRTTNIGGFPGGIPNLNNPSIFTNDPIIDERVRAGWVYSGVRTAVTLVGNYSDQRRRQGGEPYRFMNVNLTVSPNLSTRYRLSGSIIWQKDDPRDFDLPPELGIEDQGDSYIWTYALQLSRTYSQGLSTALTYRFRDREATNSRSSYHENSITATVSFSF